MCTGICMNNLFVMVCRYNVNVYGELTLGKKERDEKQKTDQERKSGRKNQKQHAKLHFR